ncbi:stalk domain-containing protein [Desulforamulus ruminis]|uniref:Copper amine oxidase-like domain-containing protein n=1 Tax=Desulforamulus ruminis (strain ATCC 23193 / DSM 2154 / NCIMB 8452 / DL) TaxID=696281 RepID=F6DP52_DESRL|nr:copper amine oxidase N-terminal domain-containing protein [Desulforamulus ruminis]AEG61881.1 copper amine oxidase-like domain-containing protein [Desulforamulus ruminis DSM 2154]
MKLRKANKAISILVTLAMLIGLLLPAGSAFAASEYTTIKANTVEDDAVQDLGAVFAHFTAGQLEQGDVVTFRLPSDFEWRTGSAKTTSDDWNTGSVQGSAYKYGIDNYVLVPDKVGGDNNALAGAGMLQFTRLKDNEVKMQVVGNPSSGDDAWFYIYAKKVYVDDGFSGQIDLTFDAPSGSGFPAGSATIGNASGGAVNVTVSSVDSFSNSDEIKIRITEDRAGALEDEDESVLFKLPKGFAFKNPTSVSTIWGDSDLADALNDSTNTDATIFADDDELQIDLANGFTTDSATCIEIVVDIEVDDETDAKLGEIMMKISGESDIAPSELKVGNYGNYETEIKVDGDVPTVYAGMLEQQIANLIITESVAESLIDGRTLTLELPANARWGDLDDDSDSGLDIDVTGFPGKDGKTAKFTFSGKSSDAAELILEDMEVVLEPGVTGDLKVKVGGTAGLTGELVVAKIVNPVSVKVDSAPDLKIGTSNVAGGEIIITEAEAGAIKDDCWMVLDLPQGVRFASEPEVEVTEGDLNIDEDSIKTQDDGAEDDNQVTFYIDGDSTTASTIKISGLKYIVDRTVPVGPVTVKVKGDAVSDVNTESEVKDYFSINTSGVVEVEGQEAFTVATNGDDAFKVFPKSSSAASATVANVITPASESGAVTFTIGSTVYSIGGVTKVMDVAPYIKDSRTYVPVRYLALSLGVAEENIGYENGVVTLKKGDVTLKMTVGDKNLDNNGTLTAMDVAPEVVNGRTMLPARFVAEGFGAQVGFANNQVVISY